MSFPLLVKYLVTLVVDFTQRGVPFRLVKFLGLGIKWPRTVICKVGKTGILLKYDVVRFERLQLAA